MASGQKAMAVLDVKPAAAVDSLMTETPAWSISTGVCSEADERGECFQSLLCFSMQLGGQELQLAIKSSTEWGPEDLARLGSLVGSRNRFVCMQLVTMVKEQHKKVTTARAAEDCRELHQAQFVFLGTVSAPAADLPTPTVVSAGLFYPRWCSKDGAEMPHMYVELLCCNSPGRGFGSILLSHIEQFTAAAADYLSAAFTGCTAAGGVAVTPAQADLADGYGSTGVPAVVPMPVVLPLLAEGVAVPADPLSGCCTACDNATAADASCASSDSMQMVVGAELSSATSIVSAAAGASVSTHQQLQPQPVPVFAQNSTPPAYAGDAARADTVDASLQAADIGTAAPAAAAVAGLAAKRICGVKLLSVESARSFYERHGYGQPDLCREMFKPLLLLPPRGAAGSASSSSICSMTSVSSTSSNVVC